MSWTINRTAAAAAIGELVRADADATTLGIQAEQDGREQVVQLVEHYARNIHPDAAVKVEACGSAFHDDAGQHHEVHFHLCGPIAQEQQGDESKGEQTGDEQSGQAQQDDV
jgi:hypothetical protein